MQDWTFSRTRIWVGGAREGSLEGEALEEAEQPALWAATAALSLWALMGWTQITMRTTVSKRQGRIHDLGAHCKIKIIIHYFTTFAKEND